MSNENNVNNTEQNVNQDSQLTAKEKEFLAKQMAEAQRAEAEATQNKKRQEWLVKVRESAGKEAWEKLSSVKNSAGKTIEDVFKESPQLLDTPDATSVTIDLFKSYSNATQQTASESAGAIETGANPSSPTNSNDGGVNPSTADELFSEIKAGRLSKDDIINSKLKDSDKVMLLQYQLSVTKTSSELQTAINRMF